MARRLLPLLALALLVAAPASADNITQRKRAVDAHLARVQQQLAASKRQEGVLSRQVGSLTTTIHGIELRVGGVSQRLSVLDRDIGLHRERLRTLDELLHLQTHRFRILRSEYRVDLWRLETRLISDYENPQPTTADVLLAARSFHDLLDELTYLRAIADQDKNIAAQVKTAKIQAAAARKHTLSIRRTVRAETQVIRGRAQQVAILRATLLSSQGKLAGLRGAKQQALATTQKDIQAERAESQSLQAASDELAALLRKEEGGGSGGGGTHQGAPHFIWPVNGPITSPFGMRWGVLHPGIDIGVPIGTPVHAAAAGKIVWCGWMTGYGDFVVIDHGGGYATAYGHNSKILVKCGEEVSQGQVVSLSGCTGYCTGPHVHFEVRINGTPVDPLNYLP